MKKLFFVLILLLCLTGCETYKTITSNITDDAIYDFTHDFLNVNVKTCHISALYPQPASPNSSSRYYVPSKFNCYLPRSGHQICGYDCKMAAGRIKCGYLPTQRCVVGSSGYIACGYDCKKTWREANCGIRYGDTCVVSQSQQVICGLNCRVEDGYIKCDPAATFRAAFPQANWP